VVLVGRDRIDHKHIRSLTVAARASPAVWPIDRVSPRPRLVAARGPGVGFIFRVAEVEAPCQQLQCHFLPLNFFQQKSRALASGGAR
jgi:hypothetical protein